MILEHYGLRPLVWPPRDYEQTNYREGWGHPPKPEGLWVSAKGEYDWPWWCRAEGFREEHLAVCTRVILANNANIRLVKGEGELLAFDAEYGIDHCFGNENTGYRTRRIDWIKLAKDYDGLIIAPYVWSCRLGEHGQLTGRVSDWYYPWDCASGVIWKARAIAAFEVMEEIDG